MHTKITLMPVAEYKEKLYSELLPLKCGTRGTEATPLIRTF